MKQLEMSIKSSKDLLKNSSDNSEMDIFNKLNSTNNINVPKLVSYPKSPKRLDNNKNTCTKNEESLCSYVGRTNSKKSKETNPSTTVLSPASSNLKTNTPAVNISTKVKTSYVTPVMDNLLNSFSPPSSRLRGRKKTQDVCVSCTPLNSNTCRIKACAISLKKIEATKCHLERSPNYNLRIIKSPNYNLNEISKSKRNNELKVPEMKHKLSQNKRKNPQSSTEKKRGRPSKNSLTNNKPQKPNVKNKKTNRTTVQKSKSQESVTFTVSKNKKSRKKQCEEKPNTKPKSETLSSKVDSQVLKSNSSVRKISPESVQNSKTPKQELKNKKSTESDKRRKNSKSVKQSSNSIRASNCYPEKPVQKFTNVKTKNLKTPKNVKSPTVNKRPTPILNILSEYKDNRNNIDKIGLNATGDFSTPNKNIFKTPSTKVGNTNKENFQPSYTSKPGKLL